MSSPAPLTAIFSTGRSGSTWLGSIVDTHPDVVYRFEPLSRLREDAGIRALKLRITSAPPDAALLGDLKGRLRVADPVTCKPPYFPKRGQPTFARAALWPLARGMAPARAAFAAAYTPRADLPLVFKEVGMNKHVIPLVRDARVRAIYLARHPCAVVSSILTGQRAGLMPTARREVAADLVSRHDPELAARWKGRIADATPAEVEALLWRIDVEEALREVGALAHVRWVVYEDLCERPAPIASELFGHIGLPASEQTQELLAAMASSDASVRRGFGAGWMNEYFSVFRDSREMASKWRRELPADVVRAILGVVSDSRAFRHCAERADWS